MNICVNNIIVNTNIIQLSSRKNLIYIYVVCISYFTIIFEDGLAKTITKQLLENIQTLSKPFLSFLANLFFDNSKVKIIRQHGIFFLLVFISNFVNDDVHKN